MSVRRAAGVACCLVVLVPAAPAPARAPAPLLVDAQEWSLTLSRGEVPAGRVSVQFVNRGEDDHDLRFQRLDRRSRRTGPTQSLPVTLPGALSERVVRLAAGRWRLWCTLDGHAGRGMRATLRVRG